MISWGVHNFLTTLFSQYIIVMLVLTYKLSFAPYQTQIFSQQQTTIYPWVSCSSRNWAGKKSWNSGLNSPLDLNPRINQVPPTGCTRENHFFQLKADTHTTRSPIVFLPPSFAYLVNIEIRVTPLVYICSLLVSDNKKYKDDNNNYNNVFFIYLPAVSIGEILTWTIGFIYQVQLEWWEINFGD